MESTQVHHESNPTAPATPEILRYAAELFVELLDWGPIEESWRQEWQAFRARMERAALACADRAADLEQGGALPAPPDDCVDARLRAAVCHLTKGPGGIYLALSLALGDGDRATCKVRHHQPTSGLSDDDCLWLQNLMIEVLGAGLSACDAKPAARAAAAAAGKAVR